MESNPIPPVPDMSLSNFEGDFLQGNDRDMRPTMLPDAMTNVINTEALNEIQPRRPVRGEKLTRKERRQAKRELKIQQAKNKRELKASKKKYASVKSQLKDRDKELSQKTDDFRRKRMKAKNVTQYIG